jgi:hypothetical protein
MDSSYPVGYSDNEYHIDEKRKRIVNARNMTTLQANLYIKNNFRTIRPDLTDFEYEEFTQKWLFGERYLNLMRIKL